MDLTRRELEIADYVARGWRNKQIADALKIKESTVKMHLHKIYIKLRIDSRLQLAIIMSDVQAAE